MTDLKPNAELAYRVLDYINEHPEEWDQSVWARKTPCGTTACFAGWAVLLSGVELQRPTYSDGIVHHTAEVEDSNTAGDVWYRDIESKAMELLGIDSAETSISVEYIDEDGDTDDFYLTLFSGSNSFDDLKAAVEDIFGPRPEQDTTDSAPNPSGGDA